MTEGLGDFDVTAVTLIGGGKMGEALLAGLVDAGHSVVVCEADELRAASLRKKYSVSTGDVRNAAANADVVIIAVKPAMVRDVVGCRGYHDSDDRSWFSAWRAGGESNAEHPSSRRPRHDGGVGG